MQYHVEAAVSATTLAAIEDGLTDADPAALVDVDPQHGRLRIATTLGFDEVWQILCNGGCAVTADCIRVPASTCCGECST